MTALSTIPRWSTLCALLLLLWTPSRAEWTLIEPGMPVLGQPGETVLFRLSGPKNRKPYLKVAGQTHTKSLLQTDSGFYTAELTLPQSGTHTVVLGEKSSPSTVQLGTVKPLVGRPTFVAQAETVTRQGPHPDYDRLTPLYPSQQVRIDGIRGRWYRCVGSATWLDGRESPLALDSLPLSTEDSGPNRLKRVRVEQAANGDALVVLDMDRCTEVQVQHSPATQTLRATLYDCYQTTFDIRRPTDVAEFLGPILMRPISKPRSVAIDFSADEFSGYEIEPDLAQGQITLRLRKPLPNQLSGLKVTVDAGHGGPKDPGTVGHGGLPEKTLNLRVAKALAEKLRELGAEVSMTRTEDSDVASREAGDSSELQSRINSSIKAGSQLFLSIHHNARPDIEDGKVSHGTDIYWFQPHSQALARALADPVADAIGEESRSFRWRSFYVIRQTYAPAVLIEFQYLSNPNLERDLLSQPEYPDKAAQGVVEGLIRYIKE